MNSMNFSAIGISFCPVLRMLFNLPYVGNILVPHVLPTSHIDVGRWLASKLSKIECHVCCGVDHGGSTSSSEIARFSPKTEIYVICGSCEWFVHSISSINLCCFLAPLSIYLSPSFSKLFPRVSNAECIANSSCRLDNVHGRRSRRGTFAEDWSIGWL